MLDGFNESETGPETMNPLISQWSAAAAAAQFPSVYPPGKVWGFWSPDINLLSYNLRYNGSETLFLALLEAHSECRYRHCAGRRYFSTVF